MANITGTAGNDTRTGTAGNDTITGLGGNDTLNGGGGNDRLEGGAGDDILTGGAGIDLLIGGAGNDTYTIDNATEINKLTTDAGTDTVRSTVTYALGAQQEHLILSGSGNLNGTGNPASNALTGNTGNNTLNGANGNDTLAGNSGNDNLIGGSGNDTLNGGAGNDQLTAGAGDDMLTFDATDTRGVNGGTGEDTLKFASGSGANFVTLNATTQRFADIEVLDLTVAGAQVITLDEATVVDMSSTNTLRIIGTAADDVVAGGGWQALENTTIDGLGYKQFQSGDALLQVRATVDTSGIAQAPINTVPSDQGTTLLDNFTIAGISVEDPDAGASSVRITLGTTLGSLSLSQTTGLTFTGGDGSEDLSMTFTGTLTSINAALDDLVYHAAHSGEATITLTAGDLGNSSTATDTFTVTVSANVNLSTLDGSNGFQLSGELPGDVAGRSVSAAGDVNGDGFDDLLAGAQGADVNEGNLSGASYVVFGTASGFASNLDLSSLNGSNGFQLSGEVASDFSGFSVSAAGDVNGDGFNDVLIGAHGATPNDIYSGASYLVFGTGSGFASNIDLSSLNGSNGFQLSGEMAGDRSGFSVSEAGDVNGDGYDDLLVGAYGEDANGGDTGATYVVFGAASGFASTLNLSSLNGSNGFQISGESGGDYSGHSVSTAGDVNGDGFDDVLIGAHGADPDISNAGATYVVFGAASGFSSNLDLSSLNGSNGFQLSGEFVIDLSGFAVSDAGDVNGDGFDDLLIGAYFASPNGTQSGATYVVFGGASGFDSNLNLSVLNGSNGFQLSGESTYDRSGFSVSAAGDVNGDGFDDVLICAFSASPNGTYSGASYLVFGAASGFASNLDLSSLNGDNGFQLSGEAATDFAGRSMSAAGDVNGDGFDDLLIGAYGADPNGNLSGASYVVFGGDIRNEVDFPGSSGNDTLTGTAAGELLLGALGNDTLSGGGGNDVVTGGAGNDTLNGNAGIDFLRGGSGNDLLNGGNDNDRLKGDEGVDTLDGGSGNDVLTGGGDNDVFLFNDATGATNVDTIMDFAGAGAANLDKVHLENSVYSALATPGALNASNFLANTTGNAATATQFIIYNTTTGELFYDADGSGATTTKVLFAVIASDVDGLSAADFVVI